MNGTHRNRPSGGLIAALAVVGADIAVLAYVAASNLADEHWLTGTLALLIAAGFTVALAVIRALMRLNGVLIDQNARLIHRAKRLSEEQAQAGDWSGAGR